MKFAKRLESEAVPEWRPKYLPYKQLKKLLNTIESSPQVHTKGKINDDEEATLSALLSPEEALFFERYEGGLRNIDEFYQAREAEAVQRRDDIMMQLRLLDNAPSLNPSSLLSSPNLSPASLPPSDTTVCTGDRKLPKLGKQPKARVKLKKALLEYYRSLELLKSFQMLNSIGCAKILKKFDKTAGRCMSDQWMKITREYPFFKSQKVDALTDHVEDVYCSTFTRGDRARALRKLRSKDFKTRSYYGSALYCGSLIGICLALLCHIAYLVISSRSTVTHFLGYVYFALSLPLLMAWLFAINAYIWDSQYINYRFIFEFNQRDNLYICQYGALVGTFMAIYLAFVFLSIAGYLTPILSEVYQPWVLVLVMLTILTWPLDHFYRQSRFWFLKVLYRVAVAPVYSCRFKDFFINDQYMSLLFTFEALGVLLFYSASGSVPQSLAFPAIWYVYLLQILPGLWRGLQCCRRFHDSRLAFPHLVNLGKYLLSLAVPITVGIDRTLVRSHSSIFWLVVVIKSLSSLTSLGWDIMMDFGLWQRDPINGRLRDTLIFSPWVYWYLIASDTVARLAWIAPAVYGRISHNSETMTVLIMALSLIEVLRRFQWNIFRVEYEHVNNCNMLRATADITLPFATTDLFYQDMVETIGQNNESSALPDSPQSPTSDPDSGSGSDGDDDDGEVTEDELHDLQTLGAQGLIDEGQMVEKSAITSI